MDAPGAPRPRAPRSRSGEWPEHSAPGLDRNAHAGAGRARRKPSGGARLLNGASVLSQSLQGFVVLRRGRGVLYVFSGHTWLVSGTPYPQPLGPLQGAGGVGRGMARFADFRDFPCTLSRCPIGGRRGADSVAGGLFAAAPQGGHGLVSALPLAGVTKKMAYGGAASVVSKGARRRPGAWMALLPCDAVAGSYMSFRAIPGSQRAPPNPQPLGPLQGAGGVGSGMARFADFLDFPCTLSRCPIGGRRGADGVVGGLCAAAP